MAEKKKKTQAKKADLAKDDTKKSANTESSAKTDKKSSEKKPSEKKSEKNSKKEDKKPSVFSRIAKYFRECKSEVKKIVWPTPKATFRNMGIVLVVLIVLGLFIFGLDTGFIALLRLIMDV